MELFHVLNRGVDKRKIFLNDKDFLRFIHDLFVFNDIELSNGNFFHFHSRINKGEIGVERPIKKPRKLLVKIHAFCLMPNHYHLLLSPVVDRGIPLFMHKLDMGYSRYFNEKNKRRGTLFQGRYKSVPIVKEEHFTHLPYYIHCNPLDIRMREWRGRKIKSSKEALKFLNSYRWSSHLDYLGKPNFPSVTQRDFLLEYFGGIEGYREAMDKWIESFDSLGEEYELE